MKELFEKISSYNIFNNLLPGILFVVISKYTTNYDFIQTDIVLGFFLYYIIGRIGSHIVESILKKIKFIHYAQFKNFIKAQQQDPKIDTLLEVSNTYRTLCTMSILLLLLKLYEHISIKFYIDNTLTHILLIVSIIVLFLFSFRKQTDFIRKRVEFHTDNTRDEN